jgi:hypothetical protein
MQTVRRRGRGIHALEMACLILLLLVGLWSCNREEPRGSESRSADTQAQSRKDGLRILYAGRPGSDREKDFVAFLRARFEVVRTGDLRKFQESDTQGFDVTLLDWDNNVFEGPSPQLSERFSRPVITLGVHGGFLCQQWRLKTGYW